MTYGMEINGIFDSIIESRRTVRVFKPDVPSRDMIEGIIKAGLWAPYAGLAIGGDPDFRKFFVIQSGSPLFSDISQLIKKQAGINLEQMEKMLIEKPFMREKSEGFLKRLGMMADNGYPDLMNAPCLIVIAERRGVPSSEKQSLAHIVQNMWLKATALGLGLRLVSIFESLTESGEFCGVLGLKPGEYGFNACIVGFAAQEPPEGKRPDVNFATKWL